MKKTLTMLAVIVTAATSLFAEEDLTQTAIYTTTAGMTNGLGNFNAALFTFKLTDDYFTGTATTTNVLTTSNNGATSFGDTMTLTSMHLVARDNYSLAGISNLAIYDGSGTLVATSVSKTTANVANTDPFDGKYWTRQSADFTFSGTDVIAKDTVYTVKFLNADGGVITTATNDTGFKASASLVSGMSIGGNGNYQPAGLVIVTQGIVPPVTPDPDPNPGTGSIPEPATATLGLLALAGLCARRRRK